MENKGVIQQQQEMKTKERNDGGLSANHQLGEGKQGAGMLTKESVIQQYAWATHGGFDESKMPPEKDKQAVAINHDDPSGKLQSIVPDSK